MQTPIMSAAGDGLGEMAIADSRAVRQIGDAARELQQLVVTARAEPQLVDGVHQRGFASAFEPAHPF